VKNTYADFYVFIYFILGILRVTAFISGNNKLWQLLVILPSFGIIGINAFLHFK